MNDAAVEKDTAGFTIIELLVVITIIGVLAAMASLGMDVVNKQRVTSSTRQLLADLQKARMDAMVTGPSTTLGVPHMRGMGVRFSSPNSYTIFMFDDSSPANEQYDGAAEEKNAQTQYAPSSVDLSISLPNVNSGAPAPPGNNVVIFDRFGLPRQSSWDALSEMAIVLAYQNATNYMRCVDISTTSIREGFWNGTQCNKE